jgi:hypothetical protein
MKNNQLNFNRSRRSLAFAFFLLLAVCFSLKAQNEYPKEVRGYKVTTAKVEVKRQKDSQTDKNQNQNPNNKNQNPNNKTETDALVQVGEPKIVRVTPLGVTFEVPVTVSAVKQGGKVDLLVFENMKVNDTNVTIEDYTTSFDIPNETAKDLPHPIRVFVSIPNAVINIFDEVRDSKETWDVKGRVYVCGHFNKFIFKFKRAVPIEIDLKITNPLKLNQLRNKEESI